jgi:hypothetical protein
MQRARARSLFCATPPAQHHTTQHVRRNPVQPSAFTPTARVCVCESVCVCAGMCACACESVLFFVLYMQYFDPVPFCFVSVFILSTYNSKLINFKNRAIHITDPKSQIKNPQAKNPQTKNQNPLDNKTSICYTA